MARSWRSELRTTIIAWVCVAAGVSLAADPSSEYDESDLWDNEGWNTSPVIRQVCDGLRPWELCSAAAESAFLSTHHEVRRNRQRLIIALANGRTVVFDDCMHLGGYTYLGTIDPLRYHLVMFSYEETIYHLVNMDTGWQARVDAFPVVSPSGEWIATARTDLERGDLPNRVQVWAVAGDTLRADYVLDGRDAAHPDTSVSTWGPLHPRWLNLSTLAFDVRVVRGPPNRWRVFPGDPMAVRHNRNGWSIVTEMVPETPLH
jgi:hypothetical protein